MDKNRKKPKSRPTKLDEVIGANIRERRELLDLTQDDLADQMGISKALLSLLERGEKPWNSTTLTKAMEFFKAGLEEFVGGVVLSEQDKKDLELIRAHRKATANIEEIKKQL